MSKKPQPKRLPPALALAIVLVFVPTLATVAIGLGVTYGLLHTWLTRGTTKY